MAGAVLASIGAVTHGAAASAGAVVRDGMAGDVAEAEGVRAATVEVAATVVTVTVPEDLVAATEGMEGATVAAAMGGTVAMGATGSKTMVSGHHKAKPAGSCRRVFSLCRGRQLRRPYLIGLSSPVSSP
jgi:hypothetical protein